MDNDGTKRIRQVNYVATSEGGPIVMSLMKRSDVDLPAPWVGRLPRQMFQSLPSFTRVVAYLVAESANRVLVTARMKRWEQSWGMLGGEAILSLRALVMSERFDAAWRILGPYWQNHGGSKGLENVPI